MLSLLPPSLAHRAVSAHLERMSQATKNGMQRKKGKNTETLKGIRKNTM